MYLVAAAGKKYNYIEKLLLDCFLPNGNVFANCDYSPIIN